MSAEFKKAAEEVKTLKTEPNNDEKLVLYALYKIGNGEEVKKPGLFDFVAKKKFEAYEKEKNEGTSQEQAQEKYVQEVEKLKTKYN